MLCPLDCSACCDALCRVDGCKLTGEPMLDICYLCGEIQTRSSHILICVRCNDEAPAPRRSGPATPT